MSLSIETDLKELLTRMDQRLERIEQNITDLKVGQSELRADIRALEERLSGKIEAIDERLTRKIEVIDERLTRKMEVLDERLSGKIEVLEQKLTGGIGILGETGKGIEKRLDNQEFLSRGLFVGLLVALLGVFARLLGWIGENP
jgi:DNA repair exonuclease SbcCD ATPase subunit